MVDGDGRLPSAPSLLASLARSPLLPCEWIRRHGTVMEGAPRERWNDGRGVAVPAAPARSPSLAEPSLAQLGRCFAG